jgi:hypothetical protein
MAELYKNLVRQCCVCGRIDANGDPDYPTWVGVEKFSTKLISVTHGYCEDCAETMRAQVRASRNLN